MADMIFVVPEPQVASSLSAIVSNLRSSCKLGGEYKDYQIEAAHRVYSCSEDHGDDTKMPLYILEDSDSARIAYMNMQQGDLRRTIRDLERYVTHLSTDKRALADELRELRALNNIR